MGFLLFLFVLAGFAYLYNRLSRAEDRLNQNQYDRYRDSEVIAELTRRVWALEKSQPAPPVESPAPPPQVEPAPIALPPPIVFDPPSIVVPPLAPAPERAPDREPVTLPIIPLPETFREPAPPPRTWRDQLRDSMGGQEWEAVVGGSWLNKLGVLVLVIGIALLLGYEFTH